MNSIELSEFKTRFAADQDTLLRLMLGLPRHPRGYQGAAEPLDLVLIGRFKCADGLIRVSDVEEMIPGEGETPQSDLFLRDYELTGTRRGTPLVDVLVRAVPIVAPGSAPWIDVIGSLFGRRK